VVLRAATGRPALSFGATRSAWCRMTLQLAADDRVKTSEIAIDFCRVVFDHYFF